MSATVLVWIQCIVIMLCSLLSRSMKELPTGLLSLTKTVDEAPQAPAGSEDGVT